MQVQTNESNFLLSIEDFKRNCGYYLHSLFQNLSGLAVPNFGENVQGCSFYRDSLYRILRVIEMETLIEDFQSFNFEFLALLLRHQRKL